MINRNRYYRAGPVEKLIKYLTVSKLTKLPAPAGQSDQELTEAKALLVEARKMRNLLVQAGQNGERVAERLEEQADQIFYRIMDFNKKDAK